MREVDALAEDTGDLSRRSSWFGRYAHMVDDPDWIRHREHGFQYVIMGQAPEIDGFFLHDLDLGLLWTRADLYPWIYDIHGGEWIHYFRGTGADGQRIFFSLTTGWKFVD